MKSYKPPKHPRTPLEWQECVDAAQATLALDSLFQYGLVESDDGPPSVNYKRCEWLLHVGKNKGYYPIQDNVVSLLAAIVGVGA